MNAARFRTAIWVCVLSLATYAVIYLVLVAIPDTRTWTDALATLIPIIVAIPAAVLTGAFTLRNSHLHAVRDLYQRLVAMAQLVIQYTHIPSPDLADYSRVQSSLSTSIDEVRLFFANIPFPSGGIGLYPFENLKDMSKVIDWIGYGESLRPVDDVSLARKCIVKLWQELHHSMVNELGHSRDIPIKPVSKYLYNGQSIADLLFDGRLTESDLERTTLASRPR